MDAIKKCSVSNIIDLLGVSFLIAWIIGYAIFRQLFAELHITIPVIYLPLFMGEILIGICLFLLFLKCHLHPVKLNSIGIALFLYFGFVLVKAYLGCYKFGFLSLRHAAMMYYVIFAVFGYFMFKAQKINRTVTVLALLSTLLCSITMVYHRYWFFSVTVLFLSLLNDHLSKREKILFLILYLLVAPWTYFFQTSRTFLLANIAGLYVLLYGVWKTTNMRRRYKTIGVILITSLVLILGSVLISSNRIVSMYGISELMRRWYIYDDKVQEKLKTQEEGFLPNEIIVIQLYDQLNSIRSVPKINKSLFSQAILPFWEGYAKDNRTIDVEYNNILFRFFIWRDMIQDIIARKAIMGIEFGYPFLSPSLIVLEWGASEWKRDGWVSAHNSFLNLIYRAGIVGVLLIGTIMFYWIKAIGLFIRERYFYGICMCSIIFSWFVAATFLPILELPYSAIPFWMFYGIMFLHYKRLTLVKS